MKIKNDDIQKLIDNRIIEPDKLPSKKGSCLIFFRGKEMYVWREKDCICLSEGHFWSCKHRFCIKCNGKS